MGASQTDLLCPNCAGQCAFDPSSGTLLCQSCATETPIAVDDSVDAAREFHYHPDLPHTEQKSISTDHIHQCETCGGEIVFTGPALTSQCAYCDGPVVLKSGDQFYQTLGMIPFSQSKDAATARIAEWLGNRRAAPSDLAGVMAQGRVAGIYVPFWTFDSHEAVSYMVHHRVKQGKNWVTRVKSGTMKTWFDDLLVPGSPHVTPLIRDGILHDFAPDRLRPYTPAYLSGFAAERHRSSVKEGLQSNAKDKDLLLRNRIMNHAGKSRVTSISYKTDTTGIHYRRILLPVWILHYSYKGKPMKVVSCGIHGRTFGERPFSHVKLLGYAAALSALAIVIGWFWGASGVL